MASHSGLGLQQNQSMAQEMRLNQYQQQSLHFLQSGVVDLLGEIEELKAQYPELQWKDGSFGEWQQGDVKPNKRKAYPGEWRLENEWQNGRFLSAEQLGENSNAKQQMLENYFEPDESPELRTVLREQIYLWNLKETEKEFCELVLQNLDERGLNYENPIFIASSLLPKAAAQKKKLAQLLQKIQELEPIGCACDSPLQSLTVQAKLRFPDSELVRVLQGLSSLEILGGLKGFLAYLQRQGLDEAMANQVLQRLRELEPYPARGFKVSHNPANFRIYPEIQVALNAATGSIEVGLLNNLGAKLEIQPEIAAPHKYKPQPAGKQKMVEQNRRRKEATLLLQQLRRREETLLSIAQNIFTRQKLFVTSGVRDLQIMTLQMIADDASLHISTISRCIQSKYCKTPWGTYPLRFFFNQGASSGQSREQIKEQIMELSQEYSLGLTALNRATGTTKLSDAQLAKRLEQFGIKVARRTVTKYRLELQSEGRL